MRLRVVVIEDWLPRSLCERSSCRPVADSLFILRPKWVQVNYKERLGVVQIGGGPVTLRSGFCDEGSPPPHGRFFAPLRMTACPQTELHPRG